MCYFANQSCLPPSFKNAQILMNFRTSRTMWCKAISNVANAMLSLSSERILLRILQIHNSFYLSLCENIFNLIPVQIGALFWNGVMLIFVSYSMHFITYNGFVLNCLQKWWKCPRLHPTLGEFSGTSTELNLKPKTQ